MEILDTAEPPAALITLVQRDRNYRVLFERLLAAKDLAAIIALEY
jgi:hypothetical protein